MARMSGDYTRCPECGRRTVLFHYGRSGEDYLACSWRGRQGRASGASWRYGSAPCSWECFRWPDNASDRRELARWQAINPGADEKSAE